MRLVGETALEEAVVEEPDVLTMFQGQLKELKGPVVMAQPNRLCGQDSCIWEPSEAADVQLRA